MGVPPGIRIRQLLTLSGCNIALTFACANPSPEIVEDSEQNKDDGDEGEDLEIADHLFDVDDSYDNTPSLGTSAPIPMPGGNFGGSSSLPVDNSGGSSKPSEFIPVPKWLVNAKKYLLEVKAGGDGWDVLIAKWLLMEEQLGYPDGQVSLLVLFISVYGAELILSQDRRNWLSTKNRPEEVKWWNGWGKKFETIPVFEVANFAVSWRRWWEGLQPSWRPQDLWPPSRDVPTDEDWCSLHRGGNNGIFLVIMCLSWWAARATSEKDRAPFEAAKQDVTWVLEQVLESIPVSSLPGKRNAEQSDSPATTKRRRL